MEINDDKIMNEPYSYIRSLALSLTLFLSFSLSYRNILLTLRISSVQCNICVSNNEICYDISSVS